MTPPPPSDSNTPPPPDPASDPSGSRTDPDRTSGTVSYSGGATVWPRPGDRPVIEGYELLAELGRGGMGVVYRARDRNLNREVALKVVLGGAMAGRAAVTRFLAEAEILAALHHPYVVQVYDRGQHQGLPFFTMEYCPGGSLGARVKDNPLEPGEAAAVVERLALGVAAAHARGILHRDLKPENVLFGDDGAPKLTDFGLAKRFDDSAEPGCTPTELTYTGAQMGTPSYMAPEQANGDGKRTGPATDVYGLGAVLYRLVTGRPPFVGASGAEIMRQVVEAEPVSPTTLTPGLPRDLSTICLKAMAKDPAGRYPAAQDLADDLRRFLNLEPIRARPLGPVARAGRWVRRNPAVAGLAAAVVLALAGGTSVATYFALAATAARDRAMASAAEAADNARDARIEKERADLKTGEAERHAADAHANLYLVRINTVQLAWDHGNISYARDMLGRVRHPYPGRPDLPGWEWDYFWRLCDQSVRRIDSRTDGVDSLAFSPDGRRVAAGGDGVRVWDLATGETVLTLFEKGWIDGVAYSPDGRRIVTAGDRVRVWDAATGTEVLTLPKTGWTDTAAFSPDGTRLATASSDHKVRVWDASTGRELRALAGHTAEAYCVAFSPDGRRLISSSKDRTVRIWDLAAGTEVHRLEGHGGSIHTLACSPDGSLIASGAARPDFEIKLWDARTGQCLHTLEGHAERVRSLAFSPDGRRMVSGSSDHTFKVWDPVRGVVVSTHRGHASGVHAVGYSPDGLLLATGGADDTLRLWSAVGAPEPRVLSGHDNQVRAVAFGPDGRLVSVGQDGRINVWDTLTGQELRVFRTPNLGHLGLAVSPDGRRLATAGHGGFVRLWDLTTGRELWSVHGHPNWVSALAFTPDGKWLVSGGAPDPVKKTEPIAIRMWEVATGAAGRRFQGHTDEIKALVFTPDGRRLISGSDDATLKVWDAETGDELRTLRGHARAVTSVALHRDGNRLASASVDRTVKVWDLARGQEVATLEGHLDAVWAVAFHPDGSRLATASWDKTVRVWDTTSGLKVAALRGHTDRVLGVAFSPDGTRLASAGGQDRTVRLWDARPVTAEVQAEVEAVAILNNLVAKPLPRSEFRALIERGPGISPGARRRALELGERFREETDPQKYHDAAWPVIRHRHANIFQTEFALAQTRAACDRAPDDLRYRVALGIAQYRLGRFQERRYAEALATLVKCDETRPATLAFLAMARHRLGQTGQARADLNRLRDRLKDAGGSANVEAGQFLNEATELIEGKAVWAAHTP